MPNQRPGGLDVNPESPLGREARACGIRESFVLDPSSNPTAAIGAETWRIDRRLELESHGRADHRDRHVRRDRSDGQQTVPRPLSSLIGDNIPVFDDYISRCKIARNVKWEGEGRQFALRAISVVLAFIAHITEDL